MCFGERGSCVTGRTFRSIISRSFNSAGVGGESFLSRLVWVCSAAEAPLPPSEDVSAAVE